jgi:proton-coupled amino acid transporter
MYGGDVVPEEEGSEDYIGARDENRDFTGRDSSDGREGRGVGGHDPSETTPLVEGSTRLRRHRTSSANASVHGTSNKKVFFMLMKAFVGTGVLFLPKAFANGGMAFSIILLILIGWLSLHCMVLLVETSRTLGGSFGDLGEKLYGPGVRSLVLASIAIAQVSYNTVYLYFLCS